jgi:hypothetical protein
MLRFRMALLLGVALACALPGAAQKQLAGEWQGTLTTGAGDVQILWHVTAATDGSLKSTFDNASEGVTGIKVKSLELKDNALTIEIDDEIEVNGSTVNIQGTYSGTLSADGNDIKGSWTQTAPNEEGPDPLELKRQAGQPAAAPAAPAALSTGAPATSAGAPAVAPAAVVGDWEGALETGAAKLRLVLHLTAGANGALSASLDSVDQGAMAIPVSSVSLTGGKLSLTIDAVNGSYEGTVNADVSAIEGTWTQGASLPLNFKRAVAKAAAKPAAPSEIDGTWTGVLDTGAAQLHVVVKIANTSDGLTAQLQSPDQGQNWIPAGAVDKTGNALKLTFAGLGADYAGKVSADQQTIDGTFTQMGNAMPLTLKRAAGK